MKKLLWMLVLIFCVSFPCGSLFGSESKKAKNPHIPEVKDFHVLKVTETGEVVIDASNSTAKPKMKFDIFKTESKTIAADPNNIIGGIELPIARIIITQTAPTYSIGFIVNRMDGSMPKSNDISAGMLCRETTKQTLKAEKKIYKYQKKALKRQYKLMKLKAKSETYNALDKTVQDINDVNSIKAGSIKVEK
ncbi:MAG: hypothetical protein ABSE89_01760 [Sedimentisphaerales bacterium]